MRLSSLGLVRFHIICIQLNSQINNIYQIIYHIRFTDVLSSVHYSLKNKHEHFQMRNFKELIKEIPGY